VTGERRARVLVAVAVVASIAFALLAHAAIVEDLPRPLGALLSLVPIAIVLAILLRRARNRALAWKLAALAAACMWLLWPQLERRFPDLFLVEHTLMNALLGAIFGRTLLAGQEPLVTRFARVVHDTIPPQVERYTRQVTLAWTLFFLAMIATSWTLHLAGMRDAWSVFATLVNPVLVFAMFGLEYAVRLRALPDWQQVGILGSVRAYMRYFRAARVQPSR